MKTREESLVLLRKYIKNEKLIHHSIAAEAVLKALAHRLGENEEIWAMAGLLHDIDVEITNADPKIHALKAIEILRENGYPEEIIEAIRLHNEEATDEKRSKKLHHALACGETITGLIIATALVYPDKKIASVKPKSVIKRMKEKAFAASVKRENIMECTLLGLTLEEFVSISLEAMINIAHEINM